MQFGIHRSDMRRDAGQAMTESAIMISLLAMAWAMMSYAAYMTSHATRCAVASRHAAWSAGNGASASASGLAGDLFFSNTNMVRLTATTGQGSDASGMLSSGNAIFGAILSIFPDIQKADVEFGVSGGGESDEWPFVLTDMHFPLMPASKVDTLMNVENHCEWDSVNENWDSIGDILTSIIEGMF